MKVTPRQLQQTAKTSQATVEGKRAGVELLESTLASQKALLAAELKKSQPDPKVVAGLRTAIGNVSTALDLSLIHI